MAAKLISPTEAIQVNQLCLLAYGQPGARKTSLAQTAEAPITFAFDPGIYRAYGRKAAVMFDRWEDVVAFDTAGYKTVVVDTVGMCLDKLGAAAIAESPKNGNRMGGLTLQGYGVLKARFAAWVGQVRERGQDLVFTAHEKAEKLGDQVYYCPDIVGGSYATLMNHCDLVGYMHFANGKRVMDFSPTDSWMAKTPPCGWGQITLPDFSEQPHFLADLIAQAKASMGQISQASASVASAVGEWAALIASMTTLAEMNAVLPDVKKFEKEHGKAAGKQAWGAMLQHAQQMVWSFDMKAKAFVAREEVLA